MVEPSASILVVDDEDAVRFFIAKVLSSRGYRVEESNCGEHALARLRTSPADLVLVDYKMAGMDGLELVRQMRQEGITSAVILLTAYGTLDMAIDLMRSGGMDFLKKPCSNQDLLESVDRALTKRREAVQRERMASLLEHTLREAQLLEAFAPVQPTSQPERFVELHGLLVDRQQEMVSRAGEVLPLTRTEYRLLSCLMERSGAPVSYMELYEMVYGTPVAEYEKHEARQALSTHLWRLRQKLGNDVDGRPYIMNVHGGAYKFI